MNSRAGLVLVLGVIGIGVSLLTLFSTPSDAVAGEPFKMIVSGLDNPRGLAFGPEGALYIMEAGRGGPPLGDPPGNCMSVTDLS